MQTVMSSFDERAAAVVAQSEPSPTSSDRLDDAVLAGVDSQSGDSHHGLTNATVMIVDDHAVTTKVLEALLQDAGYKRFVTTTRSSEAAARASFLKRASWRESSRAAKGSTFNATVRPSDICSAS